MPNPNKNKHFNDEALRINRTLKRENNALSEIVDEFENFLLNYDVEEFQWGAFHTVETEREIDVEFIPQVDDYERSE